MILYTNKSQELQGTMISPQDQDKVPATKHLGIEISKCLDEVFKTAVLRKFNKIQENTETTQYAKRFDRGMDRIQQSQAEVLQLKSKPSEIKNVIENLYSRRSNRRKSH